MVVLCVGAEPETELHGVEQRKGSNVRHSLHGTEILSLTFEARMPLIGVLTLS